MHRHLRTQLETLASVECPLRSMYVVLLVLSSSLPSPCRTVLRRRLPRSLSLLLLLFVAVAASLLCSRCYSHAAGLWPYCRRPGLAVDVCVQAAPFPLTLSRHSPPPAPRRRAKTLSLSSWRTHLLVIHLLLRRRLMFAAADDVVVPSFDTKTHTKTKFSRLALQNSPSSAAPLRLTRRTHPSE